MKVPFGSAALRLGIPGLVSCSSDVRASLDEVRTGIGFKHLATVL